MTEFTMIQTETPDTMECRACSETMRLFGIEAHPVIARAVLHTYVCPSCDGVQTRTTPAPAGRWGRPAPAQDGAFDAETTRLLGATFDTAWEAVLASDSPPVNVLQAAAVREALAKHIIDMVRQGERNPQRLVEGSLLLVRRSPAAEIELPAG